MYWNNPYGCRNFTSEIFIDNGRITIKGDNYKTVVNVKNRQVTEKKITVKGKLAYWIKWGEFEKERANGTTYKIMRYRNGTGKGKDGLTIRKDMKLEDEAGICYTFFANGRLLWQKFTYSNGVTAYYARHNHDYVKGRYPNKKPMFEITGEKLNFKGNAQGEPFIYNHNQYDPRYYYPNRGSSESELFNLSKTKCQYTFFDRAGKVKNAGTFENNQRVGEWIKTYVKYYFLSGVPVNKKLFDTPPEKIDPYRVLREPNAQARAMLLKKVGLKRVIEKCKGILIDEDKERGNALYDFPIKPANRMSNLFNRDDEDWQYDETHLRILKVTCTTTKGEYFLRVPALKRYSKCEEARQGTFNGFEPEAKPVTFKLET
jgi:hypothetical protein